MVGSRSPRSRKHISITYDIYGDMPGQDENAAGAMDRLMATLKR